MARPQRATQPPARLEDVSAPPRVRAVRQTRAATKKAAPKKVFDPEEDSSDCLSSSSHEDDDYDADAEMEKKRKGRSRYVKAYRHHHYTLRYHAEEGFHHLLGPHGIPKYLVKLPEHKPIILPSLDVRLILDALERPERLSTVDILHWIKSNEVLPIVERWIHEIDRKSAMRGVMLVAFRADTFPWLSRRQYALSWSLEPKNDTGNPHIGLLARYASLLVNNNRLWFEGNFSKYELEIEDKHRLAISVLLVAWSDMQNHPTTGFFALLLDSPLATPKYMYSRKILDMWFIIDEAAIQAQEVANLDQIRTQQIQRDIVQEKRQQVETPRPLAMKAKHKKLAVSLGEQRAARSWKSTGGELGDGLEVFKMVSELHGEVTEHKAELDRVKLELQRARIELDMLKTASQQCTCQHRVV